MMTPKVSTYIRGTLCVLVVVPIVFLAVYPVMTILLPERMAILTDLLQDLTIVLLLEALVVPVAGAVLYWRARRRATELAKGIPRENVDTRDVY